MANQQHQRGYIYEAFNAFHVRYYATENRDGVLARVQKSHKLCRKEGPYKSATCRAVKNLAENFLHDKVNAPAQITDSSDMKIVDFWTNKYLPLMKSRLKASTLRGYQQIWRTQLQQHFGDSTLQSYERKRGQLLLKSLADAQKHNKTTLKHIRSVASAIFAEACEQMIVSVNPWKDMPMPSGAREPENTPHYTIEQAENMVTALVDHVDAQLVIALACFLGLGPAEISGLQWGDVDGGWIHIRRNKVLGKVGAPKTKERAASIPIIDQVRVPLELWRTNSESTGDGDWIIPDLHNLTERVIKPHVRGRSKGVCPWCGKKPRASGVEWKGLYSGRRGACTAVVEATNGNYAVAQALLRHKSMTTTLNVYKKAITQGAFQAGMKQLEAAVTAKK